MKGGELGRGERVLDGLHRLRLPLPWPGVPHCNAWAIASGDGLILVDCGLHQDGSLAQLDYAMTQVGLAVSQVGRLVITHAHSDHYGQAAPVLERSGAELWMHPAFDHAREEAGDRDLALAHQFEIGRQAGVPDRALRSFLERMRGLPSGFARIVEPDHLLRDGVILDSDLGPLEVIETPGHAPSHVVLWAPERRLLISGDHLLGRVSLHFDYGWTPDPVQEFLDGLDRVEGLDAQLCVSGHGRPFRDVQAHIRANRELIAGHLDAVRRGLVAGPRTAVELAPEIFGDTLTPFSMPFRLLEALAYLEHLRRRGEVEPADPDDAAGSARWRLAGQP